jgi:hypothetical protein
MHMTYEKAVALRTHQLHGFKVDPEALAQAIAMIQITHTPTCRARAGKKKTPPPKDSKVFVEPVEDAAEQPVAALLAPDAEARIDDAERQAWAQLGRDE